MADPPPDRPVLLAVPTLLTVSHAADVLDCSPRTVRRRIAEGALPAVIEGDRLMIRGDELRAYVEALERPGAPARRRRPSPKGRTFARLGGDEAVKA